MILQTDEQTIEDLGIFGKKAGSGIYNIYNSTNTRGGEILLEKIFRNPLSDEEAINSRSNIIKKFAELNLSFPYRGSLFDTVEKYLIREDANSKNKNDGTVLGEKEVQNGVVAIIEIVWLTNTFIEKNEIKNIHAFSEEREAIAALIADPAFIPVLSESAKSKLSYSAVTAYDALFRITEKDKIETLLNYIYRLDVYISVAGIAKEKKFIFPKALPKDAVKLKVENVYHPALPNAIGNDVSMDVAHNIIFLTGANMAGKSTLLRSLSTALYIAHIGFPVAATKMEFSVMDGIYTTVNLPDNLGIGASHFYIEVLRVKKMATELSTGKHFFILFDELFRGTNVKDAHEATGAVINGFSQNKKSLFVVSSHIIEVAEELEQKDNVDFLYLPTRMNGHVPEYTYTLEKGVTDDRHGMIIIRNEGILDILKTGKK